VPAVTPGLGLDVLANQLVEAARTEGIALTGDGGLLPALLKRGLETGLNVELTEHLGYEPNSPAGRNTGNSRNGTFDKTVTTEIGPFDLQVPRDRAGTFDPQLVPHVSALGMSRSVLKGGKREAERLAAQLASRPAPCSGKLTVAELLDEYLEHKGPGWSLSSRRD